MRLLRTAGTDKYTLKTYHDDDFIKNPKPKYAILSHCWQRDSSDITFEQLASAGLHDFSIQTPALEKIRNACAQAHAHKHDWIWIDSCCINKADPRELSLSLNSMFQYYQDAAVCYAYLGDIKKASRGPLGLQNARWCERGWTLQELVAPRYMEFYDQNWEFLGTRKDLAPELRSATNIEEKYLVGQAGLDQASVATRMSWMAGRLTKEIEDIAYALIGILGVRLEIKYGDGAEAFMLLQKAVLQRASDESIFAWAVPSDKLLRCYRDRSGTHARKWDNVQSWGLLAPSPDCFKASCGLVVLPDLANGRHYSWSQGAVQVYMPQRSGTEATNWAGLPRSKFTLSLNCWQEVPGGKPLIMTIELQKSRGGAYERVQCEKLGTKSGGKPASNAVFGIDQLLTRAVVVAQPQFDLLSLGLVDLAL